MANITSSPIQEPTGKKPSNKWMAVWVGTGILGLLLLIVNSGFGIQLSRGIQAFAYGLILVGIWGIALINIPKPEDRGFKNSPFGITSFILGLLNISIVIADTAIGDCSAPIDSFLINFLGLNIFYLHFGGIIAGLIGRGGDRTKIFSIFGIVLSGISLCILVFQVIKCNPFA